MFRRSPCQATICETTAPSAVSGFAPRNRCGSPGSTAPRSSGASTVAANGGPAAWAVCGSNGAGSSRQSRIASDASAADRCRRRDRRSAEAAGVANPPRIPHGVHTIARPPDEIGRVKGLFNALLAKDTNGSTDDYKARS